MQNELEKGILRYVDSSIENAPYTQIYTGLIKASGVDGYTIDLNGVEYTNVPSKGSFSTNDTVKVVIPNNQPSNMFILAESTGGGGTGAVSSVNGMTGDVVISNVSSADKLSSAKTITLTGDVTGSVSTDLSTSPTISVTVLDNSHNHVISNVDGLQTALDGKSNTGHTHGTFDNNTVLTNGIVYSNIQVTDGIVTGLATKTLTTAEIEPTTTRRYVPEIPAIDASNKFLNGDGSFTNISIGGATSSGNMYFSNVASGIATYLKLSYSSDASETTKTITVNNSADVLGNMYLYDSQIGVNAIDAGIWKSTFNIKVSNAVGNTRLKIVVFTRETTGVETDLFTKYTDEINSTNFANIYTETNRAQIPVSPTARLGFRIYGTTTSVPNITISYNIGGTNGSYINSPLALRHNQLRDKDGESAYQHITSTVKTDLTDGGDTTLHYHATDRNRANHTGTQLASTISDFASTVRSTVLTGLSTATNAIISATDTVLSALGKLQAQITANLSTLTTHIGRTDNPHSVTKTQVGLGDVDNTSDATKNVLSATKLTTAKTINLTGDVTGSVSFDGSANVSITSTVADDSHNHVISNVDNLQTTLDSKLNSSVYNATDVLTKIKTVDGSGSGLDADTVDTYHVNNTLNTGSLWTSDKILSTVETYSSHFDIVQYSGTYAVNDILTMIVPTITSNKSNGIEVLLYRNSAYESALLGIDYTYKYTSATQIQVQFFTAGTYIANYGFYNVGSWVLEWQ